MLSSVLSRYRQPIHKDDPLQGKLKTNLTVTVSDRFSSLAQCVKVGVDANVFSFNSC